MQQASKHFQETGVGTRGVHRFLDFFSICWVTSVASLSWLNQNRPSPGYRSTWRLYSSGVLGVLGAGSLRSEAPLCDHEVRMKATKLEKERTTVRQTPRDGLGLWLELERVLASERPGVVGEANSDSPLMIPCASKNSDMDMFTRAKC